MFLIFFWYCLGFSQNPDILQKVLEFAISLEVPPQDSIGKNIEITFQDHF